MWCVAAGFRPGSVGRDLFTNLFNLGGESNVPTAFSVLLLLLATLILGVVTGFRRQTRSADGFSWKALTVIFGGLALEEATGLHGRTLSMIRESAGLDGALPYAWIMADGVVILSVLFAVLHFIDHLPVTVRWRLTVGSVVYVGGALGIELLGGMGLIALAEAGLLSHLVMVAGQGMEMIGAVVFISGLLRFIRLSLPKLNLPISFSSNAPEQNLRSDG